MSRTYMNDRWCVRCSRTGMTPFLKSSLPKLTALLAEAGIATDAAYVIDIGCGNGRNLTGLQDHGFKREHMHGYDMCPSARDIRLMLGRDSFPAIDGSTDLILANYVLMFLNDLELMQVFNEINRVAKPGALLVIELYPAKDSRIKNDAEMVAFQGAVRSRLELQLPPDLRWDRVRWNKGKCVLQLRGKMKPQT